MPTIDELREAVDKALLSYHEARVALDKANGARIIAVETYEAYCKALDEQQKP